MLTNEYIPEPFDEATGPMVPLPAPGSPLDIACDRLIDAAEFEAEFEAIRDAMEANR